MMHNKLYLYHFDSRPDSTELEVKKKLIRDVNEYEFVFRIIGGSHYIECEELGIYELLSCKETGAESESVVELSTGTHECELIRSNSDGITVTTELSGEPLSVFDADDSFDLLYEFGEDAYTTITCNVVNDNIQYETYHTYPEFDVAFYSQTTIKQAPQ